MFVSMGDGEMEEVERKRVRGKAREGEREFGLSYFGRWDVLDGGEVEGERSGLREGEVRVDSRWGGSLASERGVEISRLSQRYNQKTAHLFYLPLVEEPFQLLERVDFDVSVKDRT